MDFKQNHLKPILASIGTGFFGLHLLKRAKKLGWRTQGTTTSCSRIPILEEVCDKTFLYSSEAPEYFSNLVSFLHGVSYVVVSVAPHTQDRSSDSYKKTYTRVLEDIQRALSLVQIPPKMLLFISSTSVYGDLNGKDAYEDMILEPHALSPRQLVLRDAENLALSLDPIEHKVVFRFGELTGATELHSSRNLVTRAHSLSGKAVPHSGQSITNLTHIDDGVIASLFSYEHHLDGIFNVVGDIHISRKELYEYLLSKENLPLPIWNDSGPENICHFSGVKRVLSRKIREKGFSFSQALYPFQSGENCPIFYRKDSD